MKRFVETGVLIALAGAGLLVLVLGLQNRQLREEVSELRLRADFAYPGLIVPSVAASTLTGEPVTIGEPAPGTRQVLFIFNTTCGWSRKTVPNWNSIWDQLRPTDAKGLAVYGVSIDPEDETRRYAIQEGVAFPVVTMTDQRFLSLYRIGALPTTLIVDDEGKIVFARTGSFGSPLSADSVVNASKAGLAAGTENSTSIAHNP